MNALLLPALRRVAGQGVLASLFSGLAFLRSLRSEQAIRIGRAELRVGHPPLKATSGNLALHTATTVLWGALYDQLRARRKRPGPVDACTDALLLTAVAYGIDRVIAPRRFTPGADKRSDGPRKASLMAIYGGFAFGLATGGLMALRSHKIESATVHHPEVGLDHHDADGLEALDPFDRPTPARRRWGSRA